MSFGQDSPTALRVAHPPIRELEVGGAVEPVDPLAVTFRSAEEARASQIRAALTAKIPACGPAMAKQVGRSQMEWDSWKEKRTAFDHVSVFIW